jgi:hypothetical protein
MQYPNQLDTMIHLFTYQLLETYSLRKGQIKNKKIEPLHTGTNILERHSERSQVSGTVKSGEPSQMLVISVSHV